MLVISLRLWYGADTDVIANVLGMETSEVDEITTNVLTTFKSDLMDFLNNGNNINAQPAQLSDEKGPYIKSFNNKNNGNNGNNMY